MPYFFEEGELRNDEEEKQKDWVLWPQYEKPTGNKAARAEKMERPLHSKAVALRLFLNVL